MKLNDFWWSNDIKLKKRAQISVKNWNEPVPPSSGPINYKETLGIGHFGARRWRRLSWRFEWVTRGCIGAGGRCFVGSGWPTDTTRRKKGKQEDTRLVTTGYRGSKQRQPPGIADRPSGYLSPLCFGHPSNIFLLLFVSFLRIISLAEIIPRCIQNRGCYYIDCYEPPRNQTIIFSVYFTLFL